MHSRAERLSAFRWPSPFWILACALVLGTISAGEHYMEMANKSREQLGWSHALEFRLPFWILWGALAPVVAKIARNVPREPRYLQIGMLLLAGFALSIPEAMLEYLLYRVFAPEFYPGTYVGTLATVLPYCMPNNLLIFAALVGITYAADLHTRYRERELTASRLGAQLAQAELHALRMQLNPHFLFNAMNSISSLMRSDVEAADTMLEQLSCLLRLSLERGESQLVSLREELDFIELYVGMQGQRYAGRVTQSVRCDPELYDALVPSMLLQPIVENAYVHGISKTDAKGILAIEGMRDGDQLRLRVMNSGVGIKPRSNGRRGVGLRNVEERLKLHYGAAATLDLAEFNEREVHVTVVLPLQYSTEEETSLTRFGTR